MRRTGWLDGLLVFALSVAYLRLLPDCFDFVDEGIVADTAERLYRGEILYRDIFAYWNPGAFWLNAALFRVAGISVASLRISLALFGALAAVGVWRLARDHCGRALAILAGLAGPLVCYPIWWMASPHWYSTFAALAAAVASRRCFGAERASPAVVATGLLCGITFVVLQPVGVFCLAAMAVSHVWDGAWTQSPAAAVRRIALFALGAVVPVAAMYAYYAAHAALGAMLYGTFLWNLEHFGPMLRSAYGEVNPWLRTDPPFQLTRVVLMVLPPVVYALALGWTGSRYVRRTATQRDRRLFALACVGTALLGSNYYYPDVVHLAFGATPAFAVLAALVARLDATELRRMLAPGCAVLLLGFVAFAGIGSLQRKRSECSASLSTPRGTIAVAPGLVAELSGVVSFLETHLNGDERLYVYPNGPGYNFVLGRPSPAPYVMGWPQIPGYFTEEHLAKLASSLDWKEVRYVLVQRLFGEATLSHSEKPIERYIRSHYRTARSFPLTLIMERVEDGERSR